MLKRFWNWLLGKTTVDEKIVERVERVKEEIADVKKAIEVVVDQAADVAEAAKGKPRRGRKPAAKKMLLRRLLLLLKEPPLEVVKQASNESKLKRKFRSDSPS